MWLPFFIHLLLCLPTLLHPEVTQTSPLPCSGFFSKHFTVSPVWSHTAIPYIPWYVPPLGSNPQRSSYRLKAMSFTAGQFWARGFAGTAQAQTRKSSVQVLPCHRVPQCSSELWRWPCGGPSRVLFRLFPFCYWSLNIHLRVLGWKLWWPFFIYSWAATSLSLPLLWCLSLYINRMAFTLPMVYVWMMSSSPFKFLTCLCLSSCLPA